MGNAIDASIVREKLFFFAYFLLVCTQRTQSHTGVTGMKTLEWYHVPNELKLKTSDRRNTSALRFVTSTTAQVFRFAQSNECYARRRHCGLATLLRIPQSTLWACACVWFERFRWRSGCGMQLNIITNNEYVAQCIIGLLCDCVRSLNWCLLRWE